MVVFVAATLGVVLAITAIVVDLGMERVTARDLQSLADLVAMDLAREIRGGQTQAQLAHEGDFSSSSSAVRKSAARNPDVFGSGLQIEVDWGSYTGGQWNTATDPPTAVKVTASADTDYSVIDGAGDVTRSAIAVSSNSACYRLGSFVAAVRSGDSTVLAPLNYLFGVNLDLVSYRALANAKVTLKDLAASSAIGSPTALLTGTVSYSNLIVALIDVLSKNAQTNSVAISALRSIQLNAGAVGQVALGEVLHVAPTDRAALEIAVDVLDIVGSARLVNGEHFIQIPNLNANVPGIGSQFTGGLSLISAAQLACGEPNSADSKAHNAQLEGTLGVDFINLPSLSIPGFATLLTEKGVGTLAVDIADGDGQLIAPPQVHCGKGTASSPHTYSVAVQTNPASYSLSSDLIITGDVKITDLLNIGMGNLLTSLGLSLLGGGKYHIRVNVNLSVATASAGGTSIANLSLPPNDVTPYQTGTSVYLDPSTIVPRIDGVVIAGLNASIAASKPLTDLIIRELLSANNGFVQKTLYPLIDHINNEYVGPVARMVGLRFGGADVYAVGAVCGDPDLWG